MRDNWLSNRVFTSYENILDHCCYAWNALIETPTLAHHLSWNARLDTSVLIYEDWY